MAVTHIKSNTVADFTGTVTVFNSQGSTATANATDLIRPGDWNSAHQHIITLSGNTAGTSTISGTNIVYQGGNNITLSASTAANAATIIVSGPGATVFSNSNNITFGLNGSTITASASAYSQSFGISNLGNSAGTSGIGSGVQGRFILAGGNNVTLSQSTNGASVTITVSAGGIAASVSGNSTSGGAGYSNITSGTMYLAGGPNITLSQHGNTISISAPAPGGATGALTVGVSNLGNTSNSSGMVSAQMVLVGGNNITLSNSVNGQSITISIVGGGGGGGNTVASLHIPEQNYLTTLANFQMGHSNFGVQNKSVRDYVTATAFHLPVSASLQTAANNSTAGYQISVSLVFLTKDVNTLRSVYSTTGVASASWSSNGTTVVGANVILTYPWDVTVSPGNYFVALQFSSAATGAFLTGAATTSIAQTFTCFGMANALTANASFRYLNGGNSTSSQGWIMGQGKNSSYQNMTEISVSNITHVGSAAVGAFVAIKLVGAL